MNEFLFEVIHPRKWMRENEPDHHLRIYKVTDPEIYQTDNPVYVARTQRSWGMGAFDWDYTLAGLMESIIYEWEK